MLHSRMICVTAALLSIAAAGGCDGVDINDRPDYSAFLDFGHGQDTASQDDGSDRDTTQHPDTASGDDPGTIDQDTTVHQDTIHQETSVHPDTAVHQDTNLPPGDKVIFITDREWETKANQMIAAAKTSVDLAHLEFLTYDNDITVATTLKNAQKRGVTVRVLLEGDVDANPGRVNDLDAAGIDAKLDSSSRSTHVKIIIVDDSEVLVGSTNLSKSALHFNHEANLWISDDSAVSEYADYFESLWANSGSTAGIYAPSDNSGILPIGDDEYYGAAEPVISAATSRVWLVMYEYSYSNSSSDDVYKLTELLINAKGRGVDVRAFLEDSDFSSSVDGHNQEAAEILSGGGVDVRFDKENVTTHAKLLIADDTVIVYSGNWGYNGLNNNHEAGAVVDVAAVTAEAATYFTGLWNSGVQ